MKQGDIYLTDFEPSVGHEYKKERPAIIVSGAEAISNAPLITVMPVTSNTRNRRPDDVLINKDELNRLHKNSLGKVADIYSFDRSRLKVKVGSVTESLMIRIKKYIPKHFDL